MIIAISITTRTGYNEQIRLDLGARYLRFLLYFQQKIFQASVKTGKQSNQNERIIFVLA